jgi:DNA-binding NarL/FixJ family response regulator
MFYSTLLAVAPQLPQLPREVLQRAALAWDRSRTEEYSARELLWPSLLAGRWSLIESFTAAGARYVVACRNPEQPKPPESPDPIEWPRALLPRERNVLELALAGRSGKWISFEIDLSESVVTRTLRTALRKIGASDTAALAGVPTAAFEPLHGLTTGLELAIARTTPAPRALAQLSGAERAIVRDILGGKRITAIAHERGTSPRTVAHQIGSVYRKMGASSRRELLALLA